MGALKHLNLAGPGPMAKDIYGNPNPNPNAVHSAGPGEPWNPAFDAPPHIQQPQGVVNAHPLPLRPPAPKEEEKRDKGFTFKNMFRRSKKEDPVAAARRGFGGSESPGPPGYYQGGEHQQPSAYAQGGPQPGAGSWEQPNRRNAYPNHSEGSSSGSSSRSSRGPSLDQAPGGYMPQHLAGGGSAYGRGGDGGTGIRSREPGRLQPGYAEEGSSPGGDEEPTEEMRCPISSLLMAEPVLVQSGVSYEKRCLEAWYNSGQRYCLRTGIVLEVPTYIQNIGLARQIATWCQRYQRRLPGPPTTELAVRYVHKILGVQGVSGGSDAHSPEDAGPNRPGSGHGRYSEAPMGDAVSSRPGSGHGSRAGAHTVDVPSQPDYGAAIRPGSVHGGRRSDPQGAAGRGSGNGPQSDPHMGEVPLRQAYGVPDLSGGSDAHSPEYAGPIRPGSGHGGQSDPYMGVAPVRQVNVVQDVSGGSDANSPEYAGPIRPGSGHGGQSDPYMGVAPVRQAYGVQDLSGGSDGNSPEYAGPIHPGSVRSRRSDPHMVEAVSSRPDSGHGSRAGPHVVDGPTQPDYGAAIRPGSVHGGRRSDPQMGEEAPLPQYYVESGAGSGHGRDSDPHMGEAPVWQAYRVQPPGGGSDAHSLDYAVPTRPGTGQFRHSDPHLADVPLQPDYNVASRGSTWSDTHEGEKPTLPHYYGPPGVGSGYGRHSDPHMGEAPVLQAYASPPIRGAGYGDPRMDEGQMPKSSPGAYGPHSDPILNEVQVQPDYAGGDIYGRRSDPIMEKSSGEGYPPPVIPHPSIYDPQGGPPNQHAYVATNLTGARAWHNDEATVQQGYVASIPTAAHSRQSSSSSDDDSIVEERPPLDMHAQHPPWVGGGFTNPAAADHTIADAYLRPEPEGRFSSEHDTVVCNAAPDEEESDADGGMHEFPQADAHYSTAAVDVGPARLPEEEVLASPENNAHLDDGFRVSLTHQVPELTGTRGADLSESGNDFRSTGLIPQSLSRESDSDSDWSGEAPSNPRHGSHAVPRFGPGPWVSGSNGFRPPVPSDPSVELPIANLQIARDQNGLPASESLPSAPASGSIDDSQSVRRQDGMPPSEEPGVQAYPGPHSSSESSGPTPGSFPVGLPRTQESESVARPPRLNHSSSLMAPTHDREDTGRTTLPLSLNTIPAAYLGRQAPHEDVLQGPFPDAVQKLYARYPREQEEGAAEIRRLTRESVENRISLCSGELTDRVLGGLMQLLSSPHPGVQVNAVAAIMNLSLEKQNKLKVARAGVIPHLIDLLQRGTLEAQEIAAGAMFSLALNDENKMAISVLGGIPHLVTILKNGRAGARRDAAMALYNLASVQMNRTKLVKAGGVNILLQIAHENQSGLVSMALLILSHLALIPEGRAALSEMSNIQTLVALLKGPIDRGIGDGPTESWVEVQEHAAAALCQLSNHNLRFKSQVMQAGAEEQLVVLAATGTPRARAKAAALLQMMKDNAVQDGGRESAYPRGRGRFNREQDRDENSALF